ncbi:hypothetical protein [Actinomadura fibrosa]|uniref:Integral membrane protein n=1 Tax=Actinomadura fibrosa TaxID=111802 RepID=A0ABW2XHE6_9ACTN|nr:hypothetical protein [Actinomadura fibrosa]
MSEKPVFVEAVEFNRRIQCAVWGLAVTMALCAWTTAPWFERGGETGVLWDATGRQGLSWAGRSLPAIMMVTLVLGVAAAAAASRAVARGAWICGVVNFALISVFTSGPGDGFDTRYGAGYGWLIALTYVVVFLCVAHTAPPTRRVKPVGRLGRPSNPRRAVGWMDRSFGTVDKRTHLK